MSVKTFAAIDVGSYELTMKIFEFSGKETMREIDCVSRRLDLGSDTFAMGKISNEKMDELCRTLKDFSDIMKRGSSCDLVNLHRRHIVFGEVLCKVL